MWGWSIGTVVGGLLFPPHMPSTTLGKLDDLRVSTSTYGVFIPQIWGYFRVAGNYIWATKLVEHTSTSGGGGKGGGSGGKTTSYTYTSSFATLVCRGPVTSVNRIWFNDQIIFDSSQSPTTTSGIDIEGMYLGDEAQTADALMFASLGIDPCPAYRGYCYIVFENIDLTNYGNRLPNIQVEVVAPAATMADVLADVASQCGLQPGDYDFSLATDAVGTTWHGCCNPIRQMGKAAIEPFAVALNADIVETDGKIKWVPRGNPPCRTLTVDDIGAVEWHGDGSGRTDDTVLLSYKRQQNWELPTRVEVSYFQWNATASARNYLQATQAAIRSAKNTLQNINSITFPMVLDDSIARQLAERMLYTAWVEADSWTTNVSVRHADLIPSDIVMITHGGELKRTRVVQKDEGLPGIGALSLVKDSVGVNTQFVTGGATGGIGVPFFGSGSFDSLVFQMDSPDDAFAKDGFVRLWLGATWSAGQSGVNFYVSLDGGSSYVLAGTKSLYTLMGPCSNTLGTWATPATMDTTNHLDVNFPRGSPASCSSADLANGVNAMYVGGEVMQYQTATLLSGTTWRLTNLMRGQRGTEWAIGSHGSGEVMVTVDAHLGVWATLPTPEGSGPALGTTLKTQVVPVSQALGSVSPVSITLAAPEWTPYSVGTVGGTRNMALDLAATWVSRPRWTGSPTADTPLTFVVEVWDSGSYTTLKRTTTVSPTEAWTYLAADQTTDFGSTQATVWLRIYQTNSLVGNGYKWEGSL